MELKNKVQLITYPDSLGGDLRSLNYVLLNYFEDVFKGGIHILPPYPSSGDRGFAPLTCLEIDPSYGTWDDISRIGEEYDILLDLTVNHISKQSDYFRDFLNNGRNSKFSDMFITLDKIWEDGKPKKEDIDKIFLRKTNPYSTYTIRNTGERENVWTTFGNTEPSEQVDLDINSSVTKGILTDFLVNLSKHNVRIVRLDAVGYVIKKPGTTCFFVEPEIYLFLDWITELVHSLGMELLPEVHSHYSYQFKLVGKGYWIYDFILPCFILETLINKSGKRLCSYLRNRPHNQLTMLDCHDGIPVKPDLDDLVSTEDAEKIVEVCLKRGANLSRIFSDKHKTNDGFDVHQIRCSYYSALDCNDDAYMAARAIQFFAPGIPQVYYVGLLAGKNDIENVNKTGDGREINRHNFTMDEIDQSVQKPVVQRFLKLIRFRNEYQAFNGTFSVADTNEKKIILLWERGEKKCSLDIDLITLNILIRYTDEDGEQVYYKV
jgi:sucrose 6(F)-phosphate phosphorylase